MTDPSGPTYSATQLTGFLACQHLALLNRAVRECRRKPPPPYPDPAFEALLARGLEHEAAFEEALRAEGLGVLRIQEPNAPRGTAEYWRRYTEATAEAMRAGVQVIVQGGLRDGAWVGKPDFLRRADLEDGRWTYEVIDTKLARHAKGGALLQVLLYAHLVEAVTGVMPQQVYLALGGPEPKTESFRVADYAAYFRAVRARFLAFQAGYDGAIPSAPDPVEHCVICDWRGTCASERREADHLSLVAGIRRSQSQALRRAGVSTLTALGALAPGERPTEISAAGMERIREQARIQLEGRRGGRPLYELLRPEENLGLCALPEPSPGDLFLDFEANPYAFTHGIEYLFGVANAEGEYVARWALTKWEERAAFEEFIDLVTARLERWPDLHVYHYAPYEPTALKRLMGYHATREAELDRLLRGRVLVDLLRVVKQGLRASVESYSIKQLEPLYGYVREENLAEASAALVRLDSLLETGALGEDTAGVRQAVERYNRDDCLSARALRDWLESLRLELAATGAAVPRPVHVAEEEKEDEREPTETAIRMAQLLALAPAEAPERDPHWLMAQLLEFHRREKKAFWWQYFNWRTLSEEELLDDRTAVGGARYEGVVGTEKRSETHRYRFPAQEHGLRDGSKVRDPITDENLGTVSRLDDSEGVVELRRGKGAQPAAASVLVPFDDIRDDELRGSLLRLAGRVLEGGLLEAPSAAADLLTRRPPRLRSGAALSVPGEEPVDAARRLVLDLDRSILAIQGPPGAGKTYTAARMILRALEAGLRVGVTATSHKVIANLVGEVCAAARETGFPLKAVQKADEDQGCRDDCVTLVGTNAKVQQALASGDAHLAAGTAWLWARADMEASVDLLFIDEAGQFSLANALAVTPAASSVVMLGDPRQLEQPQQGVHPPGADLSALEHLLDGHPTIPEGRGLFLERTWRLHPEICAFTSEIFYEGRLRSRSGLERQALSLNGVTGSGLGLLATRHEGNDSASAEEVEAIASLLEVLTGCGRWTDQKGVLRPVTLRDVLVVAPYNAQVSALEKALPAGARVGTVDKFQGQEAAVVIYSMTTSTPEDAPRGMEFLYSPNRLNVATSRARCAVVLVASPALFLPTCGSPRQMLLANPLCRYRELAVAPLEQGYSGTPLLSVAG